jgi:hypothetical protein
VGDSVFTLLSHSASFFVAAVSVFLDVRAVAWACLRHATQLRYGRAESAS